jgi:hypothetical protein
MTQLTRTSIHWGVLVSGSLLISSLSAAGLVAERNTAAQPQTVEFHPFTHLARIPANANLRSIRFDGIKRVHVPVAVKQTADSGYCSELTPREPGGSMFCPATALQSAVAYAATYSYNAAPMSSDENAGRRFTFQVYFRYDELAPMLLQVASGGNADPAKLAEYFAVVTYREPVRHIAIDDAQSSFCAGTYQDGVWTHSDRACQDVIRYTTATEPSGYITVQVDPAVKFRAHRSMAANQKGQ